MEYTYKTKGTCSTSITFDINGDVITNVRFTGGCNGNLKTISSHVEGCAVDYIVEHCKGTTCGFKATSCGDQLANAVAEAYEKNK